jgi:hypothetical protein
MLAAHGRQIANGTGVSGFRQAPEACSTSPRCCPVQRAHRWATLPGGLMGGPRWARTLTKAPSNHYAPRRRRRGSPAAAAPEPWAAAAVPVGAPVVSHTRATACAALSTGVSRSSYPGGHPQGGAVPRPDAGAGPPTAAASPAPASGKVGVLLLNLGGPEKLEDVQPFLYNLFADPDIIRLPAGVRFLQPLLASVIAGLRAPKSAEGYEAIGGGSPLRRITDEQAAAIRAALRSKGLVDAEVRFGRPSRGYGAFASPISCPLPCARPAP